MLTKKKLCALIPGQWVRIRVPDSETWPKPTEWTGPLAGKEVDICVIPWYAPRYDSANLFHWTYRVAYRTPGSAWPKYSKDGKRAFWFNGAMIDSGPGCPVDGSFPSLSVKLSSGTGGFCHT
jgi:hypothetical protein